MLILLEVKTVWSALMPSHSSRIVNTACDRLDTLFIAVAVVRRLLLPMKNSCRASSSDCTSYTLRFRSTSPLAPSSSCTGTHSSRLPSALFGSSRS